MIRAWGIILNFFSSRTKELPLGDHDFFWYVEKLNRVSSMKTTLDPLEKAESSVL
jgi:hypothetical protein